MNMNKKRQDKMLAHAPIEPDVNAPDVPKRDIKLWDGKDTTLPVNYISNHN